MEGVKARQVDGDKFVCLDMMIANEERQKECIIYSFGIAGDWTFEDHMDSIGEFLNIFCVIG